MIYWFLLMIVMVFADQLTKWLAIIHLKGDGSFKLWPEVFHLTYVENTGSAFGMLKDHRWVFMITSTVLIVGLLVFFVMYYKKVSPLMRCAVSMIIAGGVGNMIDRISLGYVVDFFDFTLIDFAVFNVADSFVCIGAGLFLLWFILDSLKEAKEKKLATAAANATENTEAEKTDTSSESPEAPAEETASDVNESKPDNGEIDSD